MARVTITHNGITLRVPAAQAQALIADAGAKLDDGDSRGAEAYREFVGRNPPPKKVVKKEVKKVVKKKQKPPKV